MKKIFWIITFSAVMNGILPGTLSGQGTVRINEFCALNETILTDGDGDYSDWIELFNPGTGAVNLAGWALTDDPEIMDKWIFPGVILDPGAFLVVFASGKNRASSGNELHTGFKLSSGGEYLALVNTSGVAVSEFSPAYPAQQADISYGYFNGGHAQFSPPSPGSENLQSDLVIPTPVISVPHGIYDEPFQVEILTDFPGGEIYYTLDGSTPTLGSALSYTSPLTVDRTTVIRAVVTPDDQSTGSVATSTYIFPEDVIRQPNDPAGYPAEWGPYTAINGTAIADYEMDPEMMADSAFAASVVEGLRSLPTISLVTDISNIFSHSTDPDTGGIYIYTGPPLSNETDGLGKGWERPASVEYFNTDGSESLQVNCGVRLQGGHSRRPEKCPKHSFRLVFRSEYGASRLDYPIFKDEGAVNNLNTLILRAGFGLTWVHWTHIERQQAQYQQDAWTKDTQLDLGHPSSHSEYAHLYINGIYWGIYAPAERMDADFAASYMGGKPEDFDVIKDYQDVANGDIQAWNRMMAMANAGLADNDSYQRFQGNNPDGSPNPEYEAMADVKNLADYMLINFYGGNTDWDHHNWAAMRNRVNPGKGFRFLCWDSEHVLKDVNTNVTNENNPDCPSRIFQQLTQNESFRILLADRVQELCFNGGLLTPEATAQRWNRRTEQVEPAIVDEAARWGDYRRDVHPWQSGPFDLYDYEHYWLPARDYIINTYFPQRTSVFIQQLRNAGLFPALDAPRFYIEGEAWPVETMNRGDLLTMTSGEGVIYYTTNGEDPADWNFGGGENTEGMIPEGATKYVLVPRSDVGDQWRSDLTYDQSTWTVCSGTPGGIGYETEDGYEALISLDVQQDMYQSGSDPNTSCYVRIPFTVEAGSIAEENSLLLSVQYDDGFAAFLNGVRVAEANAPLSLSWNSAASSSHESATWEVFDITSHSDLLKEGTNLLAIQALNTGINSSDFLISVRMDTTSQPLAEISGHASMYSGAIPMDYSSHVIARTYLNGNWSAAMSGFISFPEDLEDIRITEIQYNPMAEGSVPGSDLEFVELKNVGPATLDLEGVRFAEGIEYTFAPGMQLPPGGFVVLASSEPDFFRKYGFEPDGQYSGNLNNGGEILRLDSPNADTLFRILYDNASPWPEMADGTGYSMVPVELNPPAGQGNGSDWRISYRLGGSPGMDDLDITGSGEVVLAGASFTLEQNYPNPFNDVTYISYVLPSHARVDLTVFNLVGQKVAVLESGNRSAGTHLVSWDGKDDSGNPVEEGIYFYRMVVTGPDGIHTVSKKMMRF